LFNLTGIILKKLGGDEMRKVKITKEEVLEYHSKGRPGKLEIIVTKPYSRQRDLSIAYSPGVAYACEEIHANPELAYEYTMKGNFVAVISNGTAVLGLGNIGALAGKPVMEGKCLLFKALADVDAIDLEVNTQDPDEFITVVKNLEPTFGGINLEDIKAPECFYIEEKLKELLNIPVFHDDQHGTAIITTAGIINALLLVNKKPEDVRVVINGAGASGIACAKMLLTIGIKKENMILCDSSGVIYKGRTKGMNPYKEEFATDLPVRTLEEAVEGADILIGMSVKGAFTKDMIKKMASNPIIFACANPDPEIFPEEVFEVRKDAIVATGRSDYPNQVNNVLGFPFIFRGALDVRAKTINEEMKRAAALALAELAREEVPESVLRAYGLEKLEFGRDYIIPKPLDPRVPLWVAPAVAKAAMESGVARKPINDFEEYKIQLERKLRGKAGEVIRRIINEARKAPKKIVFVEGYDKEIIRASHTIKEEGIGEVILIGNLEHIKRSMEEVGLDISNEVKIIDPLNFDKKEKYAEILYELRKRKGVTKEEAKRLVEFDPETLAALMVYTGDADVLIAGRNRHYPDALSPILRVIKPKPGIKVASGVYMVIAKDEVFFFADTTVNILPTAEELAEIAICTADTARKFGVEPKVAMLSFSNFGSVKHPEAIKVAEAVKIVKKRRPDIIIDGEMQADTALDPEILVNTYPFSSLKERANVLIFPSLNAGNIAYKICAKIGNATVIGPILQGLSKSVHVLQRGSNSREIFHLAAVAVAKAEMLKYDVFKDDEGISLP
jgi:malate dehydrogenase (oxaloacetate-decarboxylating)(NADP+)